MGTLLIWWLNQLRLVGNLLVCSTPKTTSAPVCLRKKEKKTWTGSYCWQEEAIKTAGLTDDFRVILFIIWASAVVPGSEVMETVACLHRNKATHCNCVDREGLRGGVGWGVLLVGVTPVDNSTDIPVETLWHYGSPLFPWKYPLAPKQGINSSSILGISNVTFRMIQLCCYGPWRVMFSLKKKKTYRQQCRLWTTCWTLLQ